MLRQLYDDASDTVLIENNGVAQKWVAIPFWSDGAFTLPDTDTNTETDTDTDNDKFYTPYFCRSYIGLFVGQCEHTITPLFSLRTVSLTSSQH